MAPLAGSPLPVGTVYQQIVSTETGLGVLAITHYTRLLDELKPDDFAQLIPLSVQILLLGTGPVQRFPKPALLRPLMLPDEGRYVASEATMYRLLRERGQLAHRQPSAPRTNRRPNELVADGPNQVWSWDITYLPSDVRGRFFYLYLFVDVWSRRIMRAEVHERECGDVAAR